MPSSHTLTAYKCEFKYLQRNNPLIDEVREKIREQENPKFSLSDFINKYHEETSKLTLGDNTHRAILLKDDYFDKTVNDEYNKWYVKMWAGKHGQPLTLVKMSKNKGYDYGPDTAALYMHHVFFYECEDYFIAIFYRCNGSGCKSVFLETANKVLKEQGMKLEMTLLMPLIDQLKDATPTKITLQFVKEQKSSDIADNINGTKRRHIIRDLGLNLGADENNVFSRIFENMQMGHISKEEAFCQIKSNLKGSDDYNDALVNLKIGKRSKKVYWNEFETLVGTYDISDLISKAYCKSKDFVKELNELSDSYYELIIQSGCI